MDFWFALVKLTLGNKTVLGAGEFSHNVCCISARFYDAALKTHHNGLRGSSWTS
jgi:hypothetical protein